MIQDKTTLLAVEVQINKSGMSSRLKVARITQTCCKCLFLVQDVDNTTVLFHLIKYALDVCLAEYTFLESVK